MNVQQSELLSENEVHAVISLIGESFKQYFQQAVDNILGGDVNPVLQKESTQIQVITDNFGINDALLKYNGELVNMIVAQEEKLGARQLFQKAFLYNILLQEGLAYIIIELISKGGIFRNLNVEKSGSITVESKRKGKTQSKSLHPKQYNGNRAKLVREVLEQRKRTRDTYNFQDQQEKVAVEREKALISLKQRGIIKESYRIKRFSTRGVPTVEQFIFDKVADLWEFRDTEHPSDGLKLDIHLQGKRKKITRSISEHGWDVSFRFLIGEFIHEYETRGIYFTDYEKYWLYNIKERFRYIKPSEPMIL